MLIHRLHCHFKSAIVHTNSPCNMIYFMLGLAIIGWQQLRCYICARVLCTQSILIQSASKLVRTRYILSSFPDCNHMPFTTSTTSTPHLSSSRHSFAPLTHTTIQLYDFFTIQLEMPLIELRLW